MKNGKPNMMRPLHVAYIHAPTHYYWDRYEDYLKSPGFGGFDWLARFGLKLLVGPMRKWDYRAAQRPDKLIANSNFTKNQIKKYYGRDSAVIHPPVDVERFKLQTINHELRTARKGFVTAGRQTPYKRIDLAVAACTKLGLPLAVIGDGPDHKKLVRMAGPTVKFVSAEDSQMADYFQKAQAFIFPGLDDFGVVAVEAMAAGTPVIACNGGGALDYIEQDKNGNFFENQSVQNLSAVLSTFDSKKFDNLFISQQAQRFGINVFRKKMSGFLDSLKTIP